MIRRTGSRSSWAPLSLLILSAALPAQQQSVPNTVALESEEEPVREYSVEMIVFEYVGSAASTSELFDPEPTAEDLAPMPADEAVAIYSDLPAPGEAPEAFGDPASPDAIAVDDPAAGDPGPDTAPAWLDEPLEEIETFERAGIRRMPPEEYQLLDTMERLERLDAYRPLMHTGWIQPTVEKELTSPLALRRLGDPPLKLDGSVTLYLSRFLHLVVDISLEEKSAIRPGAESQRLRTDESRGPGGLFSFGREFVSPPTYYRIQEDRIVRNNELRYYDHPKFGVLAKITRIEEQAPDPLDTTGDLLPAIN